MPSPYDLEHANHYLRNTFKMEVIMSLQEQRKQRPAKYKIKNIKKAKRNPSNRMTRIHGQDGQFEVYLINQNKDSRVAVRQREKSSSPEYNGDEISHSGRSHYMENLKNERTSAKKLMKVNPDAMPTLSTPQGQYYNQLQGLRTASDGLQGPTILNPQQPRHFTNPLKYAKPFDLKLARPMEPEWGPMKPRDKRPTKPQINRSSLIA